jgi:hypothetical protein
MTGSPFSRYRHLHGYQKLYVYSQWDPVLLVGHIKIVVSFFFFEMRELGLHLCYEAEFLDTIMDLL